MPFVLLVVAVSLSVYLGGSLRPARRAREGAAFRIDPSRCFRGGLSELAIIVIAAGGLAFLNPWDLAGAWILVVLSAALVAPRLLAFHCQRALAVQSGRSYRWSRGGVSSPSAAFKENAMETVAQGARFGGGRAAARNRR
jgi:hypothetical protein